MEAAIGQGPVEVETLPAGEREIRSGSGPVSGRGAALQGERKRTLCLQPSPASLSRPISQ